MIHDVITAIITNLPIPHILPGAITGLLIAASTFLWLKRGNWSGATMLLALAIGLGALTWGVLEGQKPAPFDWGNLERLGETLVGPFEYRFREIAEAELEQTLGLEQLQEQPLVQEVQQPPPEPQLEIEL